MTLARWQANILFDLGGGAVKAPGAEITFEREDNGVKPQLYSDRAGVMTKGNPFLADVDGYAFCFVTGGAYKVTARWEGQEAVWRYVAVGLLQESDGAVGGYKSIVTHTMEGGDELAIPDDDANEIHVIKNTGTSAVTVYLPDVTLRSKPIRIVDGAFNASSYPISVKRKDGTTQKVMGGTEYVIDSNGASLGLDPNVNDANWM